MKRFVVFSCNPDSEEPQVFLDYVEAKTHDSATRIIGKLRDYSADHFAMTAEEIRDMARELESDTDIINNKNLKEKKRRYY